MAATAHWYPSSVSERAAKRRGTTKRPKIASKKTGAVKRGSTEARSLFRVLVADSSLSLGDTSGFQSISVAWPASFTFSSGWSRQNVRTLPR